MKDMTILVVDDEPSVLTSVSTILVSDYKVRVSNSGERVLKIALKEPVPDLILLDVKMHGMDGFTVLRQLKENSATCSIPVIFVTALDDDKDEEKGFELGAVDYISKPIKPSLLLARVRTHIILKQAHDFLYSKNTYLEREISRRMKENQIIQNVSIQALAHLAEIRDPETGDHILRTQSYVKILATRLQKMHRYMNVISDHYIRLLTKSAPLHDIGKVGIPDNILLKPGNLTDDEWEFMQTHSELGALAIEKAEKDVEQPVDFLELAKEIAHWHHEKWDGSGYPDHLKGEEIPLSARLMALADVFDALVSQRVYKEPMTIEKAGDIILENRGRHFDPEITDAFLVEIDQFRDIAESYRVVSGI